MTCLNFAPRVRKTRSGWNWKKDVEQTGFHEEEVIVSGKDVRTPLSSDRTVSPLCCYTSIYRSKQINAD